MDVGKVVFESGGPTRDDLKAGAKPFISARKIMVTRGFPDCSESGYFGAAPCPVPKDESEKPQVISVDKRTHRLRFDETEDRIDIIIEPK